MFATGFTYQLVFASIAVFLIGWLSLRTYLGNTWSIFISFLKAAIPSIYFAYFHDGTWTVLDDWNYYEQGRLVLDSGINLLFVFFDSLEYERLSIISESTHTFYIWWNAVAQLCFGDFYYAGVYLNIIVLYIAARYVWKIAVELETTPAYRKWLLIFFLVHWDLLAWSSFLNIKDLLVMSCTVVFLYHILQLSHSNAKGRALLGILFLSAVFLVLRYYIPVLLLAATIVWLGLFLPGKIKFLLVPVIAGLLYLVFPSANAIYWERIFFQNSIAGAGRFLLTPRPWAIQEAYGFLLVPSWLHWGCMPFTVIGAVKLWRSSKKARLLIVYFLTLCYFYALVPELSGPRHRVQVVFIIALLQYHFFASILMRKGCFLSSSDEFEMSAIDSGGQGQECVG